MSSVEAEYESYLVENWTTDTLILHLNEQNLKLDDDDLAILRKEKITGLSFLDMSKEEFMQAGLKMGPAKLLAKEVQALKEKPKRLFSSYRSLKEVLAKHGIDGNGIGTIRDVNGPVRSGLGSVLIGPSPRTEPRTGTDRSYGTVVL